MILAACGSGKADLQSQAGQRSVAPSPQIEDARPNRSEDSESSAQALPVQITCVEVTGSAEEDTCRELPARETPVRLEGRVPLVTTRDAGRLGPQDPLVMKADLHARTLVHYEWVSDVYCGMQSGGEFELSVGSVSGENTRIRHSLQCDFPEGEHWVDFRAHDAGYREIERWRIYFIRQDQK